MGDSVWQSGEGIIGHCWSLKSAALLVSPWSVMFGDKVCEERGREIEGDERGSGDASKVVSTQVSNEGPLMGRWSTCRAAG